MLTHVKGNVCSAISISVIRAFGTFSSSWAPAKTATYTHAGVSRTSLITGPLLMLSHLSSGWWPLPWWQHWLRWCPLCSERTLWSCTSCPWWGPRWWHWACGSSPAQWTTPAGGDTTDGLHWAVWTSRTSKRATILRKCKSRTCFSLWLSSLWV